MLSFLVISPYWMRYPEEHFSMANANFSSCDANKTLWKPTSFLKDTIRFVSSIQTG